MAEEHVFLSKLLSLNGFYDYYSSFPLGMSEALLRRRGPDIQQGADPDLTQGQFQKRLGPRKTPPPRRRKPAEVKQLLGKLDYETQLS